MQPATTLVGGLASLARRTDWPPGSKSITNRALLCAALATGRSSLSGALFADDTQAMINAVLALGAVVVADESTGAVTVTGVDPRQSADDALVDARQSGTTSRFILPAAALRPGRTLVDGSPQLRDGFEVELTSPLVSLPYVKMTAAVMAAFGVTVDGLRVAPDRYRPTNYVIEPDASAASYFLAAAEAQSVSRIGSWFIEVAPRKPDQDV